MSSVFDKITSPIADNQSLVDLLNIYSVLKDDNQLNRMYSYMVNDHRQISPEEMDLYYRNFFTYIVEPNVIDLESQIRQGTYFRGDDTFTHLYIMEDMQQMFAEKSAQEILRRGRIIEGTNPEIFDSLNYLFWNNGDADRIPIYVDYLRRNNINLSQEELTDWLDYRAVMEEFQNPRLMGFHFR